MSNFLITFRYLFPLPLEFISMDTDNQVVLGRSFDFPPPYINIAEVVKNHNIFFQNLSILSLHILKLHQLWKTIPSEIMFGNVVE